MTNQACSYICMCMRAFSIYLDVQLRAHAHHVWLIQKAHHLGRTCSVLSSFLGWIFCWSTMTGREAAWSFHCTRKEEHLLCRVLCRRHWYRVISFIDLGLIPGKPLKSTQSPWCNRARTQHIPTSDLLYPPKNSKRSMSINEVEGGRWNHVIFQLFMVHF